MDPSTATSLASGAISVSTLASKLATLQRLTHHPKKQHVLTSELEARLDLWSTDICGQSQTLDQTPSHVLQVLEAADPDSTLVKYLHRDFDQLQSILNKLSKETVPEDYSTDWTSAIDSMFHLSGSVKDIRSAYSAAIEPNLQSRSAILSLDGGGIRSYSCILILRELMSKVGELQRQQTGRTDGQLESSTSSEVLPRDFFDYVFGTSSGGLLAIMLGRLRMPLSDSKAAFERYSVNVFNHPSIFSYFQFLGPRYSTRRITEAIKELVEEKQLDPSRPWKQNFFASEGDPCRTGVVACLMPPDDIRQVPHLFRSYDNFEDEPASFTLNCGPAADEPIWAIARATSAAPFYFSPIRMKGSQYLDGGLSGHNNPTVLAISEVMEIGRSTRKKSRRRNPNGPPLSSQDAPEPASTLEPPVSLVISIGTGQRNQPSSPPVITMSGLSLALRMAKHAFWSVTDTEKTHQDASRLCRNLDIPYYRFNVEEGLQHIGLDDSRTRILRRSAEQTLLEIGQATARYLAGAEVQQQLMEAAKALLAARRTRVPPPIEPLPDLRRPSTGSPRTGQKEKRKVVPM